MFSQDMKLFMGMLSDFFVTVYLLDQLLSNVPYLLIPWVWLDIVPACLF